MEIKSVHGIVKRNERFKIQLKKKQKKRVDLSITGDSNGRVIAFLIDLSPLFLQ